MVVKISAELFEKLRIILETAYPDYLQSDSKYQRMAETIGSQLGLFYLLGNSTIQKEVRVLSFELANKKHPAYFHWSEDLAIAGTDSSRFFLVLTEFGLVSGVEILHKAGREYQIWPEFIWQKNNLELKTSLLAIKDKGNFSQEIPLIDKYLEILQELQ